MVDFTANPKFIGLDDDAFGDGETDETTQPLSVYKERRINANNRAILGVNDQVSYTPRVSPGGNFYSTLSRTGIYIYFAPVIISGSTKKIRVILRGSMVVESIFRNPLANIQFELFERTAAIGLRKFNRIYNEDTEGKRIDSGSGVWEYEADLDTIPGFRREVLNRGGQRKVYAALRMKNDTEAFNQRASVTSMQSVNSTDFTFGGSNIIHVNLDSSVYNPGSTAWLRDTLSLYSSGELVHAGKILQKDGDYYAFKGPRYDFALSNPKIQVFRSPKLFVQGITTEIVNDNNLRWTPGVNNKDRSEFFANQPVLGQHSYKHPAAFDTATTRWRPIAQGPVSRDAPYGDTHGSGWPTDWYQRWSWVPFDSGASGASVTNKITELGIVLDNDVTELRVDGTALGVDFFSGLGDSLDPDEGEVIAPENESNVLSGDSSYTPVAVRIPIIVSIEECDGGWAIPILHMQKTFTLDIMMVQPSRVKSGTRPLQSALWRSFAGDWVNDSTTSSPSLPPRFDLGLTHFFSRTTANTEHDSEWSVPDFRFLTPFSLRFNTEDADEQGTNIPTGVPLRIEFRLGTDASSDAEYLVNGAPQTESLLSDLEPEEIERLSAFFTSIVVSARAQEEPDNE